jgi:hypothetical protein
VAQHFALEALVVSLQAMNFWANDLASSSDRLKQEQSD